MDTKQVAKLSPLERFYYWIQERENIRLARKYNPEPPWTDDVILQTYRFCNVRRMDDAVSQWLYGNWYKPEFNHPNMLLACALARHFNKPFVLASIGFPRKWNPEDDKIIIRSLKEDGFKIFNAAYMVRGIGTADKTEMVIDHVCRPLVDNPPTLDTSSMQESVAALLPYWGFSSFMAGQVVADLRWGLKGTWKDKHWWAPIGPGSRRGMNRVLNRPLKKPMHQLEFDVHLSHLIEEGHKRLPESITKRMEAIDWQNCLCETDKYTRALLGEGKPKQLYRGATHDH